MRKTVQGEDRDRQTLDAMAALGELYGELDRLEDQLQRVPLWQPARALRAEVSWVREQIQHLAEIWERRLIVAIAGPSGAGKSTLLNALAGRPLSPVGLQRPTTREVVAFVPSRDDADWLREILGDTPLRTVIARNTPGLEQLILLDTPDTNTVPANQIVLERALEQADLVLTVFDAQNPRLQDNLDFLAPAIRRLPPESVVPVLNRVDRVERQALEQDVRPDLARALEREWGLTPKQIYLISARAALPENLFPQDEQPLHGLNELEALRHEVLEALNRTETVVAQRTAHAERLMALLRDDVRKALNRTETARQEAAEMLDELDVTARQALAQHLLDRLQTGAGAPLSTGLYERLAQQWWGPVGWLVVFWALVLRIVAWFKPSRRADAGRIGAAERQADLASWSNTLGSVYLRAWPPLGDRLVEAGFTATVRQAALWQEQAKAAAEMLLSREQDVTEQVLDRFAERLAWWPWQIVLNAPVLGLVVWVGVEAVGGLFWERYLGGDYFRQAAIAILIVWVAAFVLLQLILSAVVRRPLQQAVARALGEVAPVDSIGDIDEQLSVLDALDVTVSRLYEIENG